MRHPNKMIFALLAGLWLLQGSAFALSGDREQPIQLAADSVDIDEARGQSIYKGNVELIQGSIRLLANTVTVQQQGRKPNKIIAVGKVRFSQKGPRGPVKAKARRAEYVVNSELLTLIGKASLNQAGDTMRSDRIIYDRVKHRVRAGAAAKGKQRVRITIENPPK